VVCACGGTVRVDRAPTRVAVLSAFPAELAAVLEHTTIDDTVEVNGRVFRVGRLGGVPVVVGMTGIGLVNAATTTHALLERFEVAGVVVSGVAGSTLQIGDVAVPMVWALKDGTTFTAHQKWLDLAAEVAASGSAALERCTVLVTAPSGEPVCMPQEPAVVVGGVGQSTDPFVGKPFSCRPNGGDIYGCDVAAEDPASGLAGDRRAIGTVATADAEAPIANDMETAAIAREAAARGLPFIAFRAVSDGNGDPLRLPGFLAQFAAYYRFAAHNAAAATAAFIERLAAAA
jgi:nucleoside phosphorylase